MYAPLMTLEYLFTLYIFMYIILMYILDNNCLINIDMK